MPNPQNPIFSAGVATDINLMVASNRALSYLTYAIDGVQTSFTVVDGTKYAAPCLVQIDTEIILVGVDYWKRPARVCTWVQPFVTSKPRSECERERLRVSVPP